MDTNEIRSIREWRTEHFHQSLQDFAGRIGVSISALSNWERGVSAPRRNMRQRIADRLGLRYEQITYGERPKEMPAVA